MIKANNVISDRGNPITNQIIITDTKKETETFQSYNSIIAFIDNNGKVFLDEYYWDYSTTTGKYRNMFLGNWGIDEAREKIKSGEYKLKNLN